MESNTGGETMRQTNMNELELKERVAELEKKLAHYEDNCTIVWMVEDVEFLCREYNYNRPSKGEARDLLAYVERKHDASLGVSWDTIAIHMDWWSQDEELEWPTTIPDDTYYEELDEEDWGDHPLNNREVEYND